jgi:hypothetical protein
MAPMTGPKLSTAHANAASLLEPWKAGLSYVRTYYSKNYSWRPSVECCQLLLDTSNSAHAGTSFPPTLAARQSLQTLWQREL